MRVLLDSLLKINPKPLLFERGEPKFWDDPHISKSMLEAHLNPNHDAASRKPDTIDKTVRHLFESKALKPGMKVLDLGCGPGLYSERICQAGAQVVGLDISERSIEYAEKSAARAGLAESGTGCSHIGPGSKIEYHCMNFFDMEYDEEFDAVIQVYGELCTFSDEMRDNLFKSIHRALRKGGVFIFDVSTRVLRVREGLKNGWYISEGGFWRPGKHLVLEQGFDYPEKEVWLDQYSVIDEQGVKVYRNWFHDYSFDSISAVLAVAGFKIKHVWNDLTGSSFTGDGDWIAICAEKEEEPRDRNNI